MKYELIHSQLWYTKVVRHLPFLLAPLCLAALAYPAIPAIVRYGSWPKYSHPAINILIAGTDIDQDCSVHINPCDLKPPNFKTRTDTLILLNISSDNQINTLSIPRDSWVNIPKWGMGKINSVNVRGYALDPINSEAGPILTMRTVQEVTSIPIEGYIYLSSNAVRDIVNAIGGVTLNVSRDMKYDDFAGHLHVDLKKGLQKLNGEQSEEFLRFRHDELGDIGRVERQQVFLKALITRVKNPLNFWRLPGIIAAIYNNSKSNLTREQFGILLGLSLHMKKGINTYRVPGDFGERGSWVLNRGELNGLLDEHFVDKSDRRRLRIGVANIDAPDGSARRLKYRLENLGYKNVSIIYEERTKSKTTLSGKLASEIINDIGYGVTADVNTNPNLDTVIRLGDDAE